MAVRENPKSRARNNTVIISAALQDHIMRSLLYPDFSLSDPLLRRIISKASKDHQAKRREVGLKRLDGQEEREYVLDPSPPPLTLAQKLGLVASPGGKLTEDEWIQVKERSLLEDESAKPCPVCREEFRLQPQVLLSCSHIFHKACLRGFERCSGRKRCPLCRREQYETRVIHDAARLFKNQCAIRIQACWRGYVARKWYRNIKKTRCPKDKKLRRKFFEQKLQELNDSFVRYCQTDTEAFLSDIDRSLSSSRRVFQQLERKGISELRETDWDRLMDQVVQRGVWDCPICLTALSNPSTEPGRTHRQHLRPAVLLSCSHLFHRLCLEAFEAFTADHRPTCPLCRSAYHKKHI